MTTTYVVVRVDLDRSDTHAAEHRGDLRDALDRALAIAMPDDGTTIEYGIVEASDAGAARLMRPATWIASDPILGAAFHTYMRGRGADSDGGTP